MDEDGLTLEKAAELAVAHLDEEATQVAAMRDYLQETHPLPA